MSVARPAASRQLSLFGVEARPPVPDDLEGLLAGAGQVTRMGGTARVSIVVDERWRAAALLAEFATRRLAASVEDAPGPLAAAEDSDREPDPGVAPATIEGRWGVRTAYAAVLAPLGARWLRGAVKRPPDGFRLEGRALRLWAIAAGGPAGAHGYLLRLGAGDDANWESVGGALAAAGLPATLLGPRAGGPAYRIVGRRRLARLAELIGDPPRQAPPGAWL